MRQANAILHKNTLVFSQNSLVVSSMIYKYQDLGWKADVHMKKVIFSEKNPNFAPKEKRKLHHKSDKLYFWESPVKPQPHGDFAVHHIGVRTPALGC